MLETEPKARDGENCYLGEDGGMAKNSMDSKVLLLFNIHDHYILINCDYCLILFNIVYHIFPFIDIKRKVRKEK